jgi:hypothetical protein
MDWQKGGNEDRKKRWKVDEKAGRQKSRQEDKR